METHGVLWAKNLRCRLSSASTSACLLFFFSSPDDFEEDDISDFRQASSSVSDMPELASPRGRNDLRRKVSDDGERTFLSTIA